MTAESKGDQNMTHRRLLRPDDAALALSISRSRCYQLLAAGVLPVVRVGRSVRVPADELDAWIAAHTEGSLIPDNDEEGAPRLIRRP